MSLLRSIDLDYNQISIDAGGRVRVSQLTTLFNGKITNGNNSLIFDNTGTGSATVANYKCTLATSGTQYHIWQSKQYVPYLTGKSQFFEETFDQFAPQTNVTKRFGGFSSTAVAPYATVFDGFWLESGAGTITLNVQHEDDGTPNLSIPITSWSGYNNLAEYKNVSTWDNFTVVIFDFIWLGGLVFRTWVKTSKGIVLAHIYHYSGTRQNTMFKTPCKPVRYEIRSNGSAGSFRYICSQVASEGDIEHTSYNRSVNTGSTALNIATIGTIYPLLAIKKQTTYRHISTALSEFNMFVSSTNDILLYSVLLNPTFSAPLSYNNLANSSIMFAIGDGTITCTAATGTTIASGFLNQNTLIPNTLLNQNFYSFLGSTINDTMDQMVLCATPVTSTISVLASMGIKEY